MIRSGLVIREPWVGKILEGHKDWEMRPNRTRKRGRIALIRRGSGLVVGTAELVDCLPPLTPENYAEFYARHAIPSHMTDVALKNRWFFPWVLRNARPLPTPVPYAHGSGAVTFVNLEDRVSATIASQLD